VVKVVAILILTAFPVVASTSNRVVVRDSVSSAHRDELVDRLRAITGWNDLDFNRDGALHITNTNVDAGSKSARDLIRRAVTGERVILFEDASSRKDVIFCRVILGRFLGEPAVDADVYVVLIDFDDFRQVIGDKQARAAFDVGWAVLHEIDHVVQDSHDPQSDTSAGDCEGHINKMRRELGLPVRNSYFFSFLPVKNDANLVSRFVRLGFDQVNAASAKKRRYWLIWDAAIVGGVDPDCPDAAGRITVSGVRLPPLSGAGEF
jgi:hypothetical protein